ncbi:methyl-accepting chemotaxis protein [Methylobacterium terricola]|uniref:Methyl-accepting chemotaxis protein n=1 Tax=Methylobacterium terricola TaxID=2583531 RepID=A0A5C4L634_9HYPH|nr:methyl-accepting chemotaxis protein [Methylobacterium terricola]TNC07207.1 methyl-accepting chemotaxis protein [Methylobacterium terricola]
MSAVAKPSEYLNKSRSILLSLRYLIIGPIIILFTAFMVTGIFAIARIKMMSESAKQASLETTAVSILGKMNEMSQELRALASLAHNARDSQERYSYLVEIRKAQLAFSGAWTAYAPTVAGPEEQRLAHNLRRAWQQFLAIESEGAALDRAGERELADAVFAGPFRKSSLTFRTAVNDILAYRQTRAFERTATTDEIGQTSRMAVTVALIIAALITLAISWLIIHRVASPIASMTQVMRRLAENECDVVIPNRGRRDEIGEMAAAVQVFKDNILRNLALEQEAAFARATADEQRQSLMRDMADSFESAVGGIIGRVSSSAQELQLTARTMTMTANQTAAQSTGAASAAEQAATNVGAVAAAAEELGTSVSEIARQVAGSAHLAQDAVAQASQTAGLVRELSEAVSRIGDVTGLISTIASQTNLLALNATIEAARAGAAGRGFAVVAAEVKELASQTARATDEITVHIQRVQTSTGQAVSAIGGIASRIHEINDVAAVIAAAVQQQGAATQHIVRNVAHAATGTAEVTLNVANVVEAAKETGAAASQVLTSASELSRQSDNLSNEVAQFLGTVRAA